MSGDDSAKTAHVRVLPLAYPRTGQSITSYGELVTAGKTEMLASTIRA